MIVGIAASLREYWIGLGFLCRHAHNRFVQCPRLRGGIRLEWPVDFNGYRQQWRVNHSLHLLVFLCNLLGKVDFVDACCLNYVGSVLRLRQLSQVSLHEHVILVHFIILLFFAQALLHDEDGDAEVLDRLIKGRRKVGQIIADVV